MKKMFIAILLVIFVMFTRLTPFMYAQVTNNTQVTITNFHHFSDIGFEINCMDVDDLELVKCTNYTKCNVIIPEGITSIRKGAMENCSNIESLTIPSSVMQFDAEAFKGCDNLRVLYINSKVIAEEYKTVFAQCELIDTLYISNMYDVQCENFSGCTSLRQIYFDQPIKSIGDLAFAQCERLFYVGNIVTTTKISDDAFSGCDLIKYDRKSGLSVATDLEDNAEIFLFKIGQAIEYNNDNSKNFRKKAVSSMEPSLAKGSVPRGKLSKSKGRGIKKQNKSASVLAYYGFDVEILDEVNGGNGYGVRETCNPDYLIEGHPFDCYSPYPTTKISTVCAGINRKNKSQCTRIILNLDDWPQDKLDMLICSIIDETFTKRGGLRHLLELFIVHENGIEKVVEKIKKSKCV